MPPSSISDNNDEAFDGNPEEAITEVEVVSPFVPNISLDEVKVSVDTTKIADGHPMLDARRPSVSTIVEQVSDGVGVHNAATMHVTEASSPVRDRPEPGLDLATTRSPPSSPTGMNELRGTASQRRARHSSTIESRSPNRLSGFFSNFIYRRDPTLNPGREPSRDGAPRPGSISPNFDEVARPVSPPARPASPPPPSLPAPTLQELGLSLSAITADLCPSHFSSPPSSGAFLPPRYLLLCHPQGLDVLPLVSPPPTQPFALIRRVSFKSVVVMEQRGVLVAIAGRRDGVRVYALEEIKRAIEWRIEVEIRRERERQRRENAKKTSTRTSDAYSDMLESKGKSRNASISSSVPERPFPNLIRKYSLHNSSESHSSNPPPIPLIPRPATNRTTRRQRPNVPSSTPHSGHPPPYIHESANPPPLERQRSYVSLSLRPSSHSVANALSGVSRQPAEAPWDHDDGKPHWVDSSDEEAIDAVAAGPSGSHLDERTSATLSPSDTHSSTLPRPSDPQPVPVPVPVPTRTPTNTTTPVRRPRPANLNLSAVNVVPPEPSPAPSLLSLRRALSHLSPSSGSPSRRMPNFMDVEDDDDEIDGQITLAQALMESRLPDIPPIGTRRPQEAILLTSCPSSRSYQATPTPSIDESVGRGTTNRRRRRWSFMINDSNNEDIREPPASAPASQHEGFSRAQDSSAHPMPLPASQSNSEAPDSMPQTSRSSRFLPRIISNVLNRKGSEDHLGASASLPELSDGGTRWTPAMSYQVPPPKLEYVKLPGTKGAVFIKAVETSKKSFLAILCGDHGEKVELFAGTYRTALGLSRTFILPDSPRSLELQLQGDDLVEVFLVFAQNVFGLEPATVRVREVRIGRAERRAARRRARENRLAERGDVEDETNTNASIGVSVSHASHTVPTNTIGPPETIESSDRPEEIRPVTPEAASQAPQGEDASVAAQMGSYTTFQQLSFAPKFPLASIVDDYVIPPTYPDVLEYKSKYEPENKEDDTAVEAQLQEQTHFTPPGLPVPTPVAPSTWFYRDPKNIVHGPWKASLMQEWYKSGLLPPELPVRREEDTEFMLLGELRLLCVDPTQPFRTLTTPPPLKSPQIPSLEKPLLSPISLLTQPKHFGPPALFYSSRGGHSTAIVDARGRSVLKGKLLWSNDEDTEFPSSGKLGDIKRLEAFDISQRSLLVALRQGGLEVVDLGDALLKPADESRPNLPNYAVPLNLVGRRAPFVWKIGNPLSCTFTLVNGLPTTTKAKGSFGSSNKKSGNGPAKNTNSKADSYGIESETDQQDVLFLGRNDDDVYFCERNVSSFRIIRLTPVS